MPYKPLVDEAIKLATHKPQGCILVQREQLKARLENGYDHDWHYLMSSSSPVEAVELDATHPLYVLYTSGTTGKPKGVAKRAIVVNRLPKTRSGTILRKLIRQVAANEDIFVPSTIDDPACVAEIQQAMMQKGLVAKAKAQ